MTKCAVYYVLKQKRFDIYDESRGDLEPLVSVHAAHRDDADKIAQFIAVTLGEFLHPTLPAPTPAPEKSE